MSLDDLDVDWLTSTYCTIEVFDGAAVAAAAVVVSTHTFGGSCAQPCTRAGEVKADQRCRVGVVVQGASRFSYVRAIVGPLLPCPGFAPCAVLSMR